MPNYRWMLFTSIITQSRTVPAFGGLSNRFFNESKKKIYKNESLILGIKFRKR